MGLQPFGISLFLVFNTFCNSGVSNENSAQGQMNQFVDIVSFVHFVINLTEIVVHQSKEISSKFIQLINTYLGIENSLEPEERKNEIVEKQFFLTRNHSLILTAFTTQVPPHQSESRGSQRLLLIEFKSNFLKVINKALL
jgi:hypothetical protein